MTICVTMCRLQGTKISSRMSQETDAVCTPRVVFPDDAQRSSFRPEGAENSSYRPQQQSSNSLRGGHQDAASSPQDTLGLACRHQDHTEHTSCFASLTMDSLTHDCGAAGPQDGTWTLPGEIRLGRPQHTAGGGPMQCRPRGRLVQPCPLEDEATQCPPHDRLAGACGPQDTIGCQACGHHQDAFHCPEHKSAVLKPEKELFAASGPLDGMLEHRGCGPEGPVCGRTVGIHSGPHDRICRAQDGPEDRIFWPQDGPQDRMSLPQDGPQDRISRPQDGPQDRTSRPQDGPQDRTSRPQDGPQDRTSRPQDGPHDRISRPQDRTYRPQDCPHDRTSRPQDRTSRPQDGPQDRTPPPQDGPHDTISWPVVRPVCGPPEHGSTSLRLLHLELRHYEVRLRLMGLSNESSSDSEVDETAMGNSHSKKVSTPAVYYTPGYGVVLGSRPPDLKLAEECSSNHDDDNTVDLSREGTLGSEIGGVRLRHPRHGGRRQKSPSPASDKDSAIGGPAGSEMSQSLYSEASVNRDSFYSTCTAESGFEDFWNSCLPEEARYAGVPSLHPHHSRLGAQQARGDPAYPSSMRSLYRANHGHDPGLNSLGRSAKPGLDTLSDVSSERSGVLSSCGGRRSVSSSSNLSSSGQPLRTNVDPLVEKFSAIASSKANSLSESDGPAGPRPGSQQTVRSFHSGVEEEGRGEHSQLASCALGPGEAFNAVGGPPTGVLSTQSSPYKSSRSKSRAPKMHHSVHCQTPLRRPLDDGYDYDPAFDASESLCSFSSSTNEIDWDEDESNREPVVPSLPEGFHPSVSDLQFRQSLMQRINEWSAFAEEYNKSRVATPDAPPLRFVRRSRSLDRHIGDSDLLDPAELPSVVADTPPMEPTTERNLETLEYELQDIQGEFESITSRLHQLIQRGDEEETDSSTTTTTTPAKSSDVVVIPTTPAVPVPTGSSESPRRRSSKHHPPGGVGSTPRLIDRCLRTRWERVPSSACSTSSRSSRASSVEYVWDLADYHKDNEGTPASSMGTPQHTGVSPEVANLIPAVPIGAYMEEEWRGDTPKARTLRNAYSRLPGLLSCHRLCVVRGDNYCGLRATLYQVLSLGQRVTRGWAGIIPVMDRLHELYGQPESGLDQWTFASRLPGYCQDRLASLAKCALALYATIEEVCNLPTREEREARTLSLLNSSRHFDLELMEGLKVMMTLTMVELEAGVRAAGAGGAEDQVPVFAHLLLARDSSGSVREFVRNHLNPVGDTGGLEQVEMCLLAYTLGVRIRVLRLSQLGQQDFDCTFPEDVPSEWPEVCLIAEDDRHYNVPLP